ncbi:MAG: LPS-assembly protein LptD [Proteobacteria bacterium]|nr:LPS-assembly protein LptD [Pseudomonadota bacterium]
MTPLRRLLFISIFLSSATNSYAFTKIKSASKTQAPLPSVLKADAVNSDQINNLLDATGNVELRRENSTVYADQITYNKNTGWVKAIGHIKIKNIEIGNVVATDAKIKDDFSTGVFSNSVMVMSDGSYLTSPEIDRETPQVTVLQSSIYSICPNPEISADNSLAGKKRDLFSIKSQTTTIDRGEQNFKIKHGVIRLYNFPVFYTPYLKSSFPQKGRQSGFLAPSYVRNKFGFGVNIPYYFNIAPNKDLTVTTYANPGQNLFIVKNEFRHLTSYGEYKIIPEIANNNITYSNDATTISRSTSPYRWNLQGKGIFDFTRNTGLDFDINDVYDRNYLRDYHNNYVGYTQSKINVDYIHRRDYYAVKVVKFQELENPITEKAAPTIFPMIDSHIETGPMSWKEKYALTSNVSVLTREDGLQYRRATATPEINLPVNISGNLFNFNAKVQSDFYSLENNFKGTAATNKYDSTLVNYKPSASINWSLPLIKRSKTNNFMIEPMANIVTSSFKKNYTGVPSEDTGVPELTVSNLFLNDRISGYDRNESGTRTSYGARTSFFNQYGEYGLTLGQSFRIKDQTQDVSILGFNNNNKSNFVGLTSYKAKKYFNISYAFQLNESNYQNEVNEVIASLNLNRFTFSSNYLLLLRNSQNDLKKEQISFSSKFSFTPQFSTTVMANKDLVTGRILSRSLAFNREGCCTIFSFTATQSNQSNLTKPSTSYTFSISFKNL